MCGPECEWLCKGHLRICPYSCYLVAGSCGPNCLGVPATSGCIPDFFCCTLSLWSMKTLISIWKAAQGVHPKSQPLQKAPYCHDIHAHEQRINTSDHNFCYETKHELNGFNSNLLYGHETCMKSKCTNRSGWNEWLCSSSKIGFNIWTVSQSLREELLKKSHPMWFRHLVRKPPGQANPGSPNWEETPDRPRIHWRFNLIWPWIAWAVPGETGKCFWGEDIQEYRA